MSLVWDEATADIVQHSGRLGHQLSFSHLVSIWYCSLSVQSVGHSVVWPASVGTSESHGQALLTCRVGTDFSALGHQVFDEDVTRDWLLHWTGLLTAGTALGKTMQLVFGQLSSVIQVLGSSLVLGQSALVTVQDTVES